MPAYWLARAVINDPDAYKRYAEQVPAILARHGGKFLARGGDFKTLEGPETFKRFVVIEFPTLEDGITCFASQAYQDAAAHRRENGAAEVELVIVDAGAAG